MVSMVMLNQGLQGTRKNAAEHGTRQEQENKAGNTGTKALFRAEGFLVIGNRQHQNRKCTFREQGNLTEYSDPPGRTSDGKSVCFHA